MLARALDFADSPTAAAERLSPSQQGVLAVSAHSFCISTARRWVTDLLRRWDIPPETCDSAILIVSEFATNAVQHGRSDMSLFIACDHVTLRIAVTDSGAAVHHCVTNTDPDEHGRGLQIVRALAHRTQVHQTTQGCRASASLRLEARVSSE
ncbi:ATP-binding protein [Streptomyces sp. NPDC056296]|uniref:ATP-binding protein n=1 Tax=Streptomyces sp. NPDC056296 TaxID=3345775 RepID=UPI0035DD7AEE